jgi:integrase
LNLTWSDIDFESGRLRVVRKRAMVGKAEWTPKDKDMRVLHMPVEIMNVLTNLHGEAEEGQVYVFVNAKGPNQGSRMKHRMCGVILKPFVPKRVCRNVVCTTYVRAIVRILRECFPCMLFRS